MLFYMRVVVAQNERALVFRNRVLQRIERAGVYRYFDWRVRTHVEVYDLTEPKFEHPQLDVMLVENADLAEAHFDIVELGANQVGLVSRNGRLVDILAPSTRTVYWKGPVRIEVQILDIGDTPEIEPALARQLVMTRDTQLAKAVLSAVLAVDVEADTVGLLTVDGRLSRTLQPGVYAFWRFTHRVQVEKAETRVQAMDVSGQEILTKDKVSLRVNLGAQYRVIDPVMARQSSVNAKETLYTALQFALRQAIGTRSLDVLLTSKGELDGQIGQAVTADVAAYGIEVVSVGVKDIILPGEMKDILNKVVEAEKAAQANVIKRREETAATRSLLNTAKLMEENPTLMRLKELETLEKVTEKVDRLTVFGGLDGVLQDTVRINLDSR